MTQKRERESVVSFMRPAEFFQSGDMFIPFWGALLLASLFCSWIQGSSVSLTSMPGVSALEFSLFAVQVGFFGGILVIIASFIRETRIRGGVCLGAGLLALIILFTVSGLHPDIGAPNKQGIMQSSFQIIDNVFGWGPILYGFSAFNLVIWGAGELKKE